MLCGIIEIMRADMACMQTLIFRSGLEYNAGNVKKHEIGLS